MNGLPRMESPFGQHQRGITGLESAIVLIAFTVVSSVFAFAVLSTGLFSADKSRETIHKGLGEARGTLEVKGSVVIKSATTSGLTTITDAGTPYALGKTPILHGSETILSGDGSTLSLGTGYTINYDTGVVTTSPAVTGATATYTQYTITSIDLTLGIPSAGLPINLGPGDTLVTYSDDDTVANNIKDFGLTKLGKADGDNLLENGEVIRLNVKTSGFGLTDNDRFIIQVKPPQGAVIRLERTIPERIQNVMNIN